MSDRSRTKADPALIAPGTIFDTPYESGCVALSAPDEQGNFDGVDSDGVVCGYFAPMVERIITPETRKGDR